MKAAKTQKQLSGASDFSPSEAKRRFEAALRGAKAVGHKPMKAVLRRSTQPVGANRGEQAIASASQSEGNAPMAKSSGGGKRTENPPPKTSQKVERTAAKKLGSGATAAERSLAGSVMRHIEPRRRPGK